MMMFKIYLNDHRKNFDKPVFDFCLFFSFIGTFKVKKPGKSGVKLFTVMDVHLRPDAAYKELLDMRVAIKDFITKHPQYFDQSATSLNDALKQNVINATIENKPSLKTNHPILIVGDFNADCSYISLKRQESLRFVLFKRKYSSNFYF
jgi:hypothetical protein